jgi:hypothetical protein
MMKDGTKYIDERTGDVWEIRHKHGLVIVWNDKLGEGHWDNGKHLRRL